MSYLCTVRHKNITMMRKIFSAVVTALTVFAFASCGGERFDVEGNITEAKDSILYFEKMGLQGAEAVDSVKLGEEGTFRFSDERPDAPEFYRLRIAGQMINLAVDSTETVVVKATYATMPTDYEVSGSEECSRIKQLSQMQIDLQNRAIALERDMELGRDAIQDSLTYIINVYKTKVKTDYIFKDPKAASSYFALFQTLGNYLIFNPRTNRDDIKVFAAVATSWDTYYPNSERGENLHNIAISGMKNERIVDAKAANSQIDANKVTTAGLIDITLADNKGNQRSLSQLKGKVVMLDFHVFGTKESAGRILTMRELYDKYRQRGFEIYQVSLDSDEHFWKQQTAALPWISVRDADGVNSHYLTLYNVRALPEYFLIDRNNTLVSRSSQISDIDKAITSLIGD